MEWMQWVTVAGNLLAFAGSVIISSDLLLSNAHIKARGKTYFGGNPFIIQSTKLNILAFLMIFAGFSATLGVELSKAASLDSQSSILVMLLLLIGGLLVITLLWRLNEKRFESIELNRLVKIFESSVEGLKDQITPIIGVHNEIALFETYKPSGVQNIRNKFSELSSENKTQKREDIIEEINLSETASQLVEIIDAYLKK